MYNDIIVGIYLAYLMLGDYTIAYWRHVNGR